MPWSMPRKIPHSRRAGLPVPQAGAGRSPAAWADVPEAARLRPTVLERSILLDLSSRAAGTIPALVMSLLLISGLTATAREPIHVDFLMDKDPLLVWDDPKLVFSEKLKPLWLKAWARPEADLQRQVADSFANGHTLGMPGLKDVPAILETRIHEQGVHPLVRLSTVRALVILDARQHAESLARLLALNDIELAAHIEPALARWDYKPVREVWLKRIGDPAAGRRLKTLAIRGLGTVRERRAADPLRGLAADRLQPSDRRLESAVALAKIQTSGLEDAARSMLADRTRAAIIDRMVGVRLLDGHTGDKTVEVLQTVARDEEPAVATASLSRLLALSPDHVLPHADWGVPHLDAGVRKVIAEALFLRPSPERIRLLSTLLDDAHPDNRSAVREWMFDLAAAHRQDVIDSTMAMLNGQSWRGLEQSCLLLGALDHKPAAGRLLELMDFERKEVFVTAAWALRELAVADTLPRLLELTEKETAKRAATGHLIDGRDEWEALVFETFGKLKYDKADAILRQHVPKNPKLGLAARGAGIWALGHLYAGKAPADLAAQFYERAMDAFAPMPETPIVRIQSTIALGRIGAKDYAPRIKDMIIKLGPPITLAGIWAVEQLTGEKLPRPAIDPRYAGPWFLEPAPRPLPDLPQRK